MKHTGRRVERGPLHVLWRVSFDFWVTWSISSWQKFYKSVFFPKAMISSRTSFSVSHQLRLDLSAKWMLSILSDISLMRKTLKYFSQLEIDHVTQKPKETRQRTCRGPQSHTNWNSLKSLYSKACIREGYFQEFCNIINISLLFGGSVKTLYAY